MLFRSGQELYKQEEIAWVGEFFNAFSEQVNHSTVNFTYANADMLKSQSMPLSLIHILINIFVLVTILGHLPVILSAKSKGSENMEQILIVEDDSFLNKKMCIRDRCWTAWPDAAFCTAATPPRNSPCRRSAT